ncbi:hypothetical protein BD413DRAFT_633936 [Trametes elegans]|nr:hypothetical protein BD413DRAFT_633936 [Trametes elegans]
MFDRFLIRKLTRPTSSNSPQSSGWLDTQEPVHSFKPPKARFHPSKMNVLVYSGPSTSPTSLSHTLSTLRANLLPNYAVQPIAPQSIVTHPWAATCALLVVPSFLASASPIAPNASAAVQRYAEQGGKVLVLGARVSPSTEPDAIMTLHDPASTSYYSILRLHNDDLSVTTTTLVSHEDGTVASVPIGRGVVQVWGANLEYPTGEGMGGEGKVVQILRESLSNLGLVLPAQHSGIARPTAQVLTGAPWRPAVVDCVLKALDVADLSTAGENGYELKDSNDTFLLHPASAAAGVLGKDPSERYPSDNPDTWNPKHIVVYGSGELPQREYTPRFDIQAYYTALADARKERGCPESYTDERWGFGEALLYGDVVTSTQTMLDKNTRLLTSLPSPLLSLATSQLTGRGRGGNVWLSPPGCLQFSLLLRAPLSALPAQKVVFVQYLAALALAEACRDASVLGDAAGARVRIKWPNDIYAELTGTGERRKIGGILVNTSFGAGRVELVVGSCAGCGLNVLNPPPIASLAQLLPPGSEQLPTMERTLAAVMARFERMWAEFVAARGSFEPFMDLYLDRWLHSDQLVTLTTVSPARKVRVVGITPDHGLLRTLPERDGWAGAQAIEYIDLQPDGNSFDLMAGLIKTKT